MGIRRQPETGQRADPVAGFQRSRARGFLRTGQGRRVAARGFRKIRRGGWAGVERPVQRLFDAVRRYRFQQRARMSACSRIRVAAMTGIAHFYLGNLEEAWSRFREAMRLDDAQGRFGSPPIGGSDTSVFLRGYGAWFRAFQGYLDEAAALVDEARAIANDKNHAYSEAWTLSLMAEVRLREGRYAEAEATANQAMDLCD